jgi:hypothetical protein
VKLLANILLAMQIHHAAADASYRFAFVTHSSESPFDLSLDSRLRSVAELEID